MTTPLRTVLRFADLAVAGLGEAREEIDALNVYPVPDGDTGTNLLLTVEAARDALREATGVGGTDPEDGRSGARSRALSGLAHGALLGARGSSGVILAQLLGAATRHLVESPEDHGAAVVAQALRAAADAGYAAVGDPVEGTMLTVARCAADAAVAAADRGDDAGEVVRAAAGEARRALARTPEQLTVLREAGTVDAGGRGVCVVLDALETAVTGVSPVPGPVTLGVHAIPVPGAEADEDGGEPPAVGEGDTTGLSADGPSYEVMYLLDGPDTSVPGLREALAPLGDSLVVVGGEGLWHVHVHVDDVGAALEAGMAAGRPRRIRVTHFAEQGVRRVPAQRRGRTVLALAAGPGLASLFAEAGAEVLTGPPTDRPSTQQLLDAIERCGAREVVVLPNDDPSFRAAEAAARAAQERGDVRVQVIPTRAQVQGLAALAVHEPGRAFDADVLQMTATARHARHGAVTVATRRAMTMAGRCEPGDVLGAIEGDFVVVGQSLEEVAATVLERLLGGGGELVTIVTGVDGADLAARAVTHVAQRHPSVDVVVYDGGQDRYPLLVSVE